MTIYEKPRAELFAQDAPESEIEPFTAWLRGLGIAFDETGGLPKMESFNGLLQALNGYIKYLEQNGFAEWSVGLEYPVGAGVRVGAVWYRAKTQNINKPPSTSQNDWSLFLNASDLSFGDPIQLIDGIVSIKDASTSQRGVTYFANASEVANKTNISKAVNPSSAAIISQSTDLGAGQTYKNVISSRSLGTAYRNNTPKPITIYYGMDEVERSGYLIASVDGVTVGKLTIKSQWSQAKSSSFIVPAGSSYTISGNNISFWSELS